MTTNYQMLHINKLSADTRVWIGKLDFVDGVSQLRMRTASGTVFNFNCITDRGYTSLTNNGQLLEAQGTIVGHSIQYLYSGGSTLVPLIYLNGAGASDSSISDICITSASSVNTPCLKLDTVSRVNINKFYSTNMRNSTSNVELKSITSCILSNFNMVASGNVGTGVGLNVLTDSLLANWTITGFSKGVDQVGTAAITRCTAINCNISGNTTQTDVLANSFTVLNASSIQL